MNATKTAQNLIASQALAAGASNVAAAWDLTKALGGLLTARITNGGTGPTVGATVTVNISTDNAAWRKLWSAAAGTAAAEVDDFSVAIPPEALYAQVSIGGNTGQAVTIEAFGHELTSFQ